MRCYKSTRRQRSKLPLPAQETPGNFGPHSAQFTSATGTAKSMWKSNRRVTSVGTKGKWLVLSGRCALGPLPTHSGGKTHGNYPLSCLGIATTSPRLTSRESTSPEKSCCAWDCTHLLHDRGSRSRGWFSLIMGSVGYIGNAKGPSLTVLRAELDWFPDVPPKY